MRRLFAVTVLVLSACAVSTADGSGKEKATVDLFGSVEDETLKNEAPESGVIVSAKAWGKLARAWGIKDPAEVDFGKEILVVQTTVGSRLNVTTKLGDNGDLKVLAAATRDLRPGFRYVIKSVSKEGVKTVNGKELPKE